MMPKCFVTKLPPQAVKHMKICVHRGGCSLTYSACTPPARVKKNQKSEGCVLPLWSSPLAALRFGSMCMEEEKERKNNAKFSGHYVRPRMHNVCVHTLRSHQKKRERETTVIIVATAFGGT